jgi:hypothetical protein
MTRGHQPDSYDSFHPPLVVTTGLTPGDHSLTIEVTGTANPNSSGTRVVVHAFAVYQEPEP